MIFFKPHQERREARNAVIIAFILAIIIVFFPGKDDKTEESAETTPSTTVTYTDTIAEDVNAIYDLPQESAKSNRTTPVAQPSVRIDDSTIVETNWATAFNFTKSGYAGCGLDGTVMPFEAYYGVYAEANKGEVTCCCYDHTDSVKAVKAAVVRTSDEAYCQVDISTDGTSLDFSKHINDIYLFCVWFDNGTGCYQPLYVNDGEVWIVEISGLSTVLVNKCLTRQDAINKLAADNGITPENSLDVGNIAYPTYRGRIDNHRCDTDLWRDLAHEIVTDDSLSDSVKITMLHDWMTENLSYDNYVVNTIKKSRANYNKCWDGTYSVYNTKTGKCSDFCNIFLIMARELGIPCSTLSTETHAWNIVYIDGAWHEVDLTEDIHRQVYGVDVTDVSYADNTICYNRFLTATSDHLSSDTEIGHAIYTDEFARTGIR